MAHIRSYETARKRKGKTVRVYRVVWREPVTDEFGVPIPGKTRARQESYPTRDQAEERRDALNSAKHTVGGTTALADAKKAGEQPFGYYAQSWLDAQSAAVSNGDIKSATAAKYQRLLEFYVLPGLGDTAVAALSPAECRRFRAALLNRGSRVGDGERLSSGTVGHIWRVFRAVLDQAFNDGAISSNPSSAKEFQRKRGTGDKTTFEHHPLTIEQLGALSTAIAGEVAELPAYPVYALMVEFLAASGVRASENTGLEIGDLVFPPVPVGTPIRAAVKVQRTKKRKDGKWIPGTLKTKKSRRTVPLPDWLAERLVDYLAEHPRGDDPTAPLWPGRSASVIARTDIRRQTALDWDEPVDMGTFYRRIFRPALLAVRLHASEPARPATKDCPARPAVAGVRVHDLRHTFAVQHLSSGTPFMQVSEWLGHADYVVTLTVYADWMPTEATSNTLPEPPRCVPIKPPNSNVVNLFEEQAG
ncbi:tyrosine-type recombinase/integrase [Mycobacteroides salmoniphilum]|uniref:tyrosine-type recombinase/integrase n=1 Tax=Mycobacteroides salmoniphilum TaxID=404941 RepID=UPI003566CC2A